MMKKQVYIWLIISALAMIVASCNHVPSYNKHYDKRLVEVDTIVAEHPSEAKSILSEINPNDLNEANAAYYNLLYTQACYINYDDFTDKNDSIIQQALDYFTEHKKDKDKYIRSLIYKGAVCEVLGLSDSLAMVYYKKAELFADKNDFFNRGYAQLRMGNLYKNKNAYDGRDIEKYELAADNFRKNKNDHYLMITLKDLGAMYRFRMPSRAEKTLNEAIMLAQKEKKTANYIHCVTDLAYLYFMQGDNEKAYHHLQDILTINQLDSLSTTFDNAVIATIYANINKVDSALVFLEKAKAKQQNDSAFYNSFNYLVPMSQIAKAQGNMFEYYKLSHINDSIDFSFSRKSDVITLMYSEIEYDLQDKKTKEDKRKNKNLIISGIVTSIILALLALALLFYRRAHRYDKLVIELKDQSQNQIQDLAHLQGNISEMKINDERLKGFISSHMAMMREMIETCYHEPNNRIAESMKRIVKFQDSNRENWVKLYDYIDLEHNNIMTRTRENFPQLNDRDLLLLALTCMGYSYIQTAIVMGYSNATSVSVLKQRLAKKMGLECSLNEYIELNDKL